MRWLKTEDRPDWLILRQSAAFSPETTVCEVKTHGRVLVTKEQRNEWYRPDGTSSSTLRNIKRTLGIERADVLSCQTPQMSEKEFWAHLLAYNLIRRLVSALMLVSSARSSA